MKLIVIFLVISKGASTYERNIGEIKTNDLEEHLTRRNQEGKQEGTLQTQTIDEVKLINKKCMEESGVDKQIISTVLRTAVIPKRDPNYLKFLACSYRKQKYANEKGQIQFQNIKQFLSRYYSRKDLRVLDVCEELKQTENAGENAFNVLKCILPNLVRLEQIIEK